MPISFQILEAREEKGTKISNLKIPDYLEQTFYAYFSNRICFLKKILNKCLPTLDFSDKNNVKPINPGNFLHYQKFDKDSLKITMNE